MDLRLAYSDDEWEQLSKPSVWTEFANVSKEDRPLECFFNYNPSEEYDKYEYDCDSIFIFQLGSVPHKRYLVNMKLPVNLGESKEYNRKIGQVNEIELIVSTCCICFWFYFVHCFVQILCLVIRLM